MIDIDIVGQLVPNPVTMIVQLCSTLVLFLVAKKVLWKSVKEFLGKRSDQMQADLEAGEKAKQEALADRKSAAETLNMAAGKAEEIVNLAVAQAKTEKQNILDSAALEAEQARKKAHEQIEAERASMYEDLRKEMVNVAMDAAGRLIGEKSGADLDRAAVDAFVKEASAHEQ